LRVLARRDVLPTLDGEQSRRTDLGTRKKSVGEHTRKKNSLGPPEKRRGTKRMKKQGKKTEVQTGKTAWGKATRPNLRRKEVLRSVSKQEREKKAHPVERRKAH